MTARRWLIHGRVQGVGYRYFAERAAAQLGLTGYARVDFRVDAHGQPFILEINPNSCLEPNCALAAAANAAGLGYSDLVMQVIEEGLRR